LRRPPAAAEPLGRLLRGGGVHGRDGGGLVRGARRRRGGQEAGPQGLGAHRRLLPRRGVGPAVSPRVALLSLGGTIFMTQDASGAGARPDDGAGERLLATAAGAVELTPVPLANVSSSDVLPHPLRAAPDPA